MNSKWVSRAIAVFIFVMIIVNLSQYFIAFYVERDANAVIDEINSFTYRLKDRFSFVQDGVSKANSLMFEAQQKMKIIDSQYVDPIRFLQLNIEILNLSEEARAIIAPLPTMIPEFTGPNI